MYSSMVNEKFLMISQNSCYIAWNLNEFLLNFEQLFFTEKRTWKIVTCQPQIFEIYPIWTVVQNKLQFCLSTWLFQCSKKVVPLTMLYVLELCLRACLEFSQFQKHFFNQVTAALLKYVFAKINKRGWATTIGLRLLHLLSPVVVVAVLYF